MNEFDFSPAHIAALARADAQRALAEDLGGGDLTAALIDPVRTARARVLARESAVICGAPWAQAALAELDPQATLRWRVAEGARCEADEVVLEIQGLAQALLTAERTILNFLQLLSAVATKTASYVQAVQSVSGNQARIVDTRKTLPGLRLAQKYAVRTGGGTNHRIGLFDAVLIKDNHIRVAGGVALAVRLARAVVGTASVEVEAQSLDQVDAALVAGADIIMLDNLDDEATMTAIVRIAGRARVELSGNMTIERVRRLATSGADYVSVGALTHSAPAADLSLEIDL